MVSKILGWCDDGLETLVNSGLNLTARGTVPASLY